MKSACVGVLSIILFLSLHVQHKLNAQRGDRVCMSVCLFQLDNRWAHFNGLT